MCAGFSSYMATDISEPCRDLSVVGSAISLTNVPIPVQRGMELRRFHSPGSMRRSGESWGYLQSRLSEPLKQMFNELRCPPLPKFLARDHCEIRAQSK
jgi:hypothetical protein